MSLTEEFRRIKRCHRRALIERAARANLGASVARVYARGTKVHLQRALAAIPVDALRRVRGEASFRAWFNRQLGRVAKVIGQTNASNRRIQPGAKWGHGAKVLCLVLRDIVSHSHYFTGSEVARLEPLLYAPLDGVVLRRLRELGYDLPFERLREIDSAAKFHGVQRDLGAAAREAGVPRVWFDDNWGDRVPSDRGAVRGPG